MVMFIVQLLHIKRFCQFKTALNSYFFLKQCNSGTDFSKERQSA